MEQIEKILVEIQRLKKELDGYTASEGLDYIESYINLIKREYSLTSELEEAAKKHSCYDEDCEGVWYEPIVRNAFIAGAKWQENKDQETIKLAEDHAFLAGADWQKELMMKEAVEGEVMLNPYPTICLDDCKDYDFNEGDKVRIIIVKEDEK